MAAKAVQISLEETLLERIDTDPETRERGRSAFIRSAVRCYLREKEREANDQRLRDAYQGRADELAAEIVDLLDDQAWPAD